MLFIISIILAFASILVYVEMEDETEHLEQKLILQETQLDLEFTKKLFEMQNRYNSKIDDFIHNNEDIVEAFAKRDRKTLAKLVDTKFENLIKENPNFSLICFGLPEMKSFYRAHMPQKFGDDISKVYGVKDVTESKQRLSGVSVAKLGLYYRVTSPIFKDGKYIGLVAFGISLGYVNDYIHETLETESAVVVDTKELKKSKWFDLLEEGSIGKYTIIETTGELIETFQEKAESIYQPEFYVEDKEKTYRVIHKDIKDVTDKEVAKVIMFYDISRYIRLHNIYLYSFMTILSLLVVILIYVLIKTFNRFLAMVVTINDDLKELNSNLETKVEEEVAKNKEKEYQIFEQAKMVSLGEMMANIAHQWRQPLSVISTTATGLEVQKKFGELNDEKLFSSLKQINETTQYLSKTIDTFINFIKEVKEVHPVIVQERIDLVLNIIADSLTYHYIRVEKNYCKEKLSTAIVASELDQVIINILNNAKDVLVERKVEDPWIKIDLLQENKDIVIVIEDNGGGISKENLPKIFEPYFTTKHQTHGTGLGLHMSYRLVTESLQGKLTVENSENGAKFFIQIPIQEEA